jgi:sepiapterin reductase
MHSDAKSLAVIVTGASRGFGRALAIVANDSFQGNAKLILVARSLSGMEETLSKLTHHENVFCCHSMDLGNLEELDSNIEIILKDVEEASRIILFQNAGTIGHLGACRDSPSLKDMQANVNLNITSCLWLSSRFAKYARSTSKDLVIVNISSLVAIADFPTLGIYSVGKAARDKYHHLIAREEHSRNSENRAMIRTLNYAPVSIRKKIEGSAVTHLFSTV